MFHGFFLFCGFHLQVFLVPAPRLRCGESRGPGPAPFFVPHTRLFPLPWRSHAFFFFGSLGCQSEIQHYHTSTTQHNTTQCPCRCPLFASSRNSYDEILNAPHVEDSQDEEDVDRADEFESKYNFRFEEV